ncbi:1,4-alpha-glucan branching protein GlgB [Priestia megaterium]|uniref:1,4-alpha-glucan branching enzyme GlgB n=1 Tax=Priestia megaterium (strain DSM 319 / IMG 1521) TaxID=592022 RepID=D5DLV3_PRIM3|nr:1,4-alpha-glucan branching protein GlgB [Priestia megaterium]ADF41708.1 1,4-alpha-glucan branching enzyme [Priestia megaterium DSM 319]MED3944666.1 1,4-alpha-glucan branching protein GlgB [Priestia megaterium]MED4218894.1 1,4-alpha-glucan branching protein GlgB [Priestia megaterium]
MFEVKGVAKVNLAVQPTEFDVHLYHEGNLFRSYSIFGAHQVTVEGIEGVRFCVWAPHAKSVSVVGDFNKWNGSQHSMVKVNEEGIWMTFIPELEQGTIYKYEIITQSNQKKLKADPYAFFSEVRPNTASIVYSLAGYKWNDQYWRRKKKQQNIYERPLCIYELHAGSWRTHEDGSLYTYSELAQELIPYIAEQGFTHIELLPVIEHPLDRSWGYQGTGYYSATSRYGTPKELMNFIDECHQNNIGVLLDWVPGHFCKDEHGLYMFDGEPTYEYKKESDRENYVWGTANFDLGKPEVQSFLISNALFWLEYFHIDGFRVDAVANMLYWQNSSGKAVNDGAVSFLKKLNEAVFESDETVLMMAEDSTDWPLVTAPTYEGGLGFNYKWNMGWMNDVLTYMEAGVERRPYLHDKMTFSLMYAFNENFILPLSHDEVVHGKKSLLNKMPGDYWRKFAQLRLLYGYFFAHPGKKLLFMGGEFGQFDEWKDLEELDWMLYDFDMHRNLNGYMKDLIKIYKRSKPLYELDHNPDGFEWIDVNNHHQQIFSFIRKSKENQEIFIVVSNFSEHPYHSYKVGVPVETEYIEVINSDDEVYGGSGIVNKKALKSVDESFHGQPFCIEMNIPPFGISILRAKRKRGERKQHVKKEMRSDVIGRRKR